MYIEAQFKSGYCIRKNQKATDQIDSVDAWQITAMHITDERYGVGK